ncbi:MAG: hypothetical protein JWO47_354 [Candidatus Saccharibacteria bacterium]|nr:hypothetical protein [Candidatus Saccharibacteria bacterium]
MLSLQQMKQPKSSANYVVGPNLQKLFIWLAIASFLSAIAVNVYIIAQQLHYFNHLSNLILQTSFYTVGPAVMFFIAYLTSGKDRNTRASMFENFLLVSIGGFIFGVLSVLHTFTIQSWLNHNNTSYAISARYSLIPTFLTLFFYTLIIIKFRSSPKKSV